MSTAELLYNQYGPLITLAQLAKILNRLAEGLRITLRSKSSFSDNVNSTRLRLGRRVYFRTAEIATILTHPVGSPQ